MQQLPAVLDPQVEACFSLDAERMLLLGPRFLSTDEISEDAQHDSWPMAISALHRQPMAASLVSYLSRIDFSLEEAEPQPEVAVASSS